MPHLGNVGRLDASVKIEMHKLLYIAPAMTPLTKSVSGVVYDDTNTAAVRTVRLYRRSDGRMIGETITDGAGAFTIACPDTEVQRIVLDDAAGTLYNDLIDRVLPGP